MDYIELVDSGDEYFEKLWEKIDNSKICCWIITYHMKKSFISDETLRRLIRAAERGVDIVLFVDWLNYYLDHNLVAKLRKAGGKVEHLNTMDYGDRFLSSLEIFTKHIFKRHHEKVSLIDDTVIIGSANFDMEYGEKRYGNNRFRDLNIFIKGRCITQSQELFICVANTYGFNLKMHKIPEIENDDLNIIVSEPLYYRHEIQELLLKKIEEAKSRIIIVQGYFYPIKKMQKALKRAAKRGVEIEVITTKERDQPVYKDLTNDKLTKKILQMGGKVSEMVDRILHTKMYIIDDHLILGSFNHDKWSWSMNSEVVLSCSIKEITDLGFQIKEKYKLDTQEVKLSLTKKVKSVFAGFWKWFLKNSEYVMNTKKDYKYFILNSYVDDITNPIEERHALRMKKVEKYKINTSTLNMLTF
jgi:cardiolipin synthase